MTTSQIKNCLSEIGGYSTDIIIPLKEVASINTSLDQVLYPGSSCRFKFNTSSGKELLEVYEGHEDKDGNFIFDNEKIPNYIISFAVIVGFNMITNVRPSEAYKIGMAV